MTASSPSGRRYWRERHRSPLSQPKFWLYAALLLFFAAWHDYGPALSLPAWSQQAETAPAAAEPADANVEAAVAGEPAEEAHAGEGHGGGGHSDPVAPVLAAIVLILLLAKIGGDIFERMHLPAVLGELIIGVILGNFVFLTGSHALDFMQPPVAGGESTAPAETASETEKAETVTGDVVPPEPGAEVSSHSDEISVGQVLRILAGIGVVLLLFEVGLESTVKQMMSVGVSSFIVAVLGVVAPIVMGYVVCRYFFFDSWQQPIFIGATLCATSVGITARVLKDIGRSKQKESQIILGAAVIDDVLGLIVLAVVSGVIAATDPANIAAAGESLTWTISKIVLLAFGFIGIALLLGVLGVPRVFFRAANFLRGHGLLIATSLMICFGLAYVANMIGLAPIVGAFAAGLILESAHYHDLARRENVELEEALHPLTAIFVPIFFVQMGMNVKLASMTDPAMWGLAISISVIAIIGKQVCALGVTEKGLNRLAIGLGMIPRGEVGLIFAAQGHALQVGGEPVINDTTFSAVIFMVLVTTLVTPPLLKWAMNRDGSSPDAPSGQPIPEPAGHGH